MAKPVEVEGDGLGCLLFMAAFFILIGAGMTWGWGIGFLAVGVFLAVFFFIILVCYIFAAASRRRAIDKMGDQP